MTERYIIAAIVTASWLNAGRIWAGLLGLFGGALFCTMVLSVLTTLTMENFC